MSNETSCACLQPVVEEVLLKQLVNNLYNPEDHMPDNMSLEEVEAREEDVAHVHHDAASYALQEVMLHMTIVPALDQLLYMRSGCLTMHALRLQALFQT